MVELIHPLELDFYPLGHFFKPMDNNIHPLETDFWPLELSIKPIILHFQLMEA